LATEATKLNINLAELIGNPTITLGEITDEQIAMMKAAIAKGAQVDALGRL
jgi:hypothetical protein